MKKILSLMVSALMSVSLIAGENDLLWDYTETNIPTSGQDNGLYYAGYVNDAPSTNKGYNGVKLNSSGWAYFEKAAVAGKLRLMAANRKADTEYAVSVYNATKEGSANPVKGTKIADTEAMQPGNMAVIDLPAEVTGVYIERKTGAEGVLRKIEFKEDVARTFVDFEMIMCNMASEYDFTTLPAGVTASGTFNSDQHGYRNFIITVPVDGTVKFTIGDCKYGNQPIAVKDQNGKEIATLKYKAEGCYKNDDANKDKVFTYNYLGEADVLTFGPIQYCNYFKAEAAEITPCTITFKDQTGKELGKVETYEGATLEAIPYDVTDLTPFSKSEVFRGWFYVNNKKAKVGDAITGNTTIQAHVTPYERVTEGSIQTYDFANATFYPEDHETVTAEGGSYYNNHGWYFNADGSIKVQTTGKAVVVITLCQHSETGDIKVSDNHEFIQSFSLVKNQTPDGTEFTVQYDGGFSELTVTWTAKQYIHKIVVYNVQDFVKKDEVTGYILVPAGDAASFIMAMVQAQSGDKIFLPNGLYDLGETVLTTIGKDNVALIGQSMAGTIIKNAPDASTESIDKTATLKINDNVKNTYLQDLTIQNALDYYKADNGRAVCLWDRGTQTVCKNVRLLSYQDTYYSNKAKAVKYFEDCEIHGTVDFICGDGSVYFKNNLLYCEKRKKDGGGQDALTASNADALDRGYVFEGCTIKSECPVVSFGRAWNGTPQTAFLNTLVDYSAGEFSFSDGNKIQRWTKELMNKGAWPIFYEYNTHLANGTVLTPNSNLVEFIDTKDGNAKQTLETVISAEGAADKTMAYTLGDWAATAAAEATQAVCETQWSDLDANAIYMAECEGEFVMLLKGSEIGKLMVYDGKTYTLRKANARGGFGAPAEGSGESGIHEISNLQSSMTNKVIRNGQLLIIRDGKTFNAQGVEIR